MSLSDANKVQENSGTTASGTNHVVSLGSGTTDGNTIIIVVTAFTTAPSPPTGFSVAKAQGTSAIYYKLASAAETSWTVTTGVSAPTAWYVVEMSNVDAAEPVDASSGATSVVANGGTLSTGTTARTAGLSTVGIAAWGVTNKPTTDTESWAGYTNGFEEVIEVDPGAGVSGQHLAVAWKFLDGDTGTYSSTATFSRTDAGSLTVDALVATFRAADAPIAAPLSLMMGFEWGTHGGIGNTGSTSLNNYALAPSGTWNTHYLIQAGSARNSGYGLRITTTAATCGVFIGTMTTQGVAFGCNVRVVSATGTVVVWAANNPGNDLQLVYDASTTKFGLRWGAAGGVSWESGTTALNTWRWVDIRLRSNNSTYHADWRIETGTNTYTAQTSPTDPTGQSVNAIANLQLGGNVSQTATIDFDDVVIAPYFAAYPLGPHEIKILVPDTTGASVSGTAANFNEFTANGTLAAFASTSGQRIDEVPPTISASADGVVQVTLAASDYMNFPMGTYTCASDEIIAGVRAYFAEWGGTGTGTGTIGYRGWDGTTETTLVAASASYDADSLTATSSTYPLWKAIMWASGTGWTQTELDNAALRVGFSTDATPDMGIHAAYLEVAIKKVAAVRHLTVEDPVSATVDLYVHPYTSSSVSYVITNSDPTLSVNFNYSISGTPQTPVTVAPLSSQTVQVNADAFGDISDVGIEPI